ncbi:hypothetical protein JCM19379_29270 [Methyloparacoccus murrellii]
MPALRDILPDRMMPLAAIGMLAWVRRLGVPRSGSAFSVMCVRGVSVVMAGPVEVGLAMAPFGRGFGVSVLPMGGCHDVPRAVVV